MTSRHVKVTNLGIVCAGKRKVFRDAKKIATLYSKLHFTAIIPTPCMKTKNVSL